MRISVLILATLAIFVASTSWKRRKKIVTKCSSPNLSIDVPILPFPQLEVVSEQ